MSLSLMPPRALDVYQNRTTKPRVAEGIMALSIVTMIGLEIRKGEWRWVDGSSVCNGSVVDGPVRVCQMSCRLRRLANTEESVRAPTMMTGFLVEQDERSLCSSERGPHRR